MDTNLSTQEKKFLLNKYISAGYSPYKANQQVKKVIKELYDLKEINRFNEKKEQSLRKMMLKLNVI